MSCMNKPKLGFLLMSRSHKKLNCSNTEILHFECRANLKTLGRARSHDTAQGLCAGAGTVRLHHCWRAHPRAVTSQWGCWWKNKRA
uniref:Uncharacterized protein n=1 Tax=Kryptolebias marmoratus TaxID=37003 RepID=A0A3Q2ZAR2_KRYMA